jgi:hypothetical protein
MKQQNSSFVNPFRNIYSKVCFYVAALSPKPFSRIHTSAITMGAKVPENPAPRAVAEDMPDQLATEAQTCSDVPILWRALAGFRKPRQMPPAAPSEMITVNSLRDNYLRVSRQKLARTAPHPCEPDP